MASNVDGLIIPQTLIQQGGACDRLKFTVSELCQNHRPLSVTNERESLGQHPSKALKLLPMVADSARRDTPPVLGYIPMIGDKRGRTQNSNFATYARGAEVGEALMALGRDAINRRDLAAAQDYLAQAVATRITREKREEVNQLQFEIARRSR